MTTAQLNSNTPGWRQPPVHRFCVAPMLGWTDRHCRYFLRLLSKRSMLYTEMITTGAVLHNEGHWRLNFDNFEAPLALQLGGNDPNELSLCARFAEDLGYTEVNLNCGCPSSKVQQGYFGAYLMKFPELVAECVAAMSNAVSIPITVKHRIGVDRQTNYEQLFNFVDVVGAAGCRSFIVHARAAWLEGINAKQNRTLPPLDYEKVSRLKADFPDYVFTINGGIKSLSETDHLLNSLDAVMVGREAYKNPYILAQVDQLIYGQPLTKIDRLSVLESLIGYAENELKKGVRLHQITRHILGLFRGQPGARKFRQLISMKAPSSAAGVEVLKEALALMSIELYGDNQTDRNTDILISQPDTHLVTPVSLQ
jgi:tRNA-dihydrouridine synthase A